MATITQETRFELAKREMVRLTDVRDHLLSCSVGELWITFDGDTRDVVLRAGHDWRVEGNGPVVVSAFEESTLTLCHRQAFSAPIEGARRMLLSLRQWQFPPLAAFPVQLIR